MASNFPEAAIFFAASGISNEPGTRTTSVCFAAAPACFSASSADASNRSVMKLLKRLTTMPKRRPAAFRSPRIASGWIRSFTGFLHLPQFNGLARNVSRETFRHAAPNVCQLHRPGLLRVRVIKKAAAGFSAVPSRQNHALQQRRRREALLLELVEHDVGDVIGGIEPDEVEQGERTHGVAATELHGIINVLNRGGSVLQDADGVEQIRHQQAVDDESGAVRGTHRYFAKLRSEGHHLLEHRGVGGNRADHLDELHHRHGIKKVQADKTSGALRGRGDFRDADRGGVAGENGFWRTDFIESGEELPFRGHLLDDGLDHQVGVAEIVDVGGPAKPAANLIADGIGDGPLVHQPLKILLDALQAFVHKLGADFANHHPTASLRANLSDARAHQPATRHSHFLNRHVNPPVNAHGRRRRAGANESIRFEEGFYCVASTRLAVPSAVPTYWSKSRRNGWPAPSDGVLQPLFGSNGWNGTSV